MMGVDKGLLLLLVFQVSFVVKTVIAGSNCAVSSPEPTEFDELPMITCSQNYILFSGEFDVDAECAEICTPVDGSCSHCKGLELESFGATFCPSLTPFDNYTVTINGVETEIASGNIECAPMKISTVLESKWTSVDLGTGTVLTPEEFTADVFSSDAYRGARLMSTSFSICGLRDPSIVVVEGPAFDAQLGFGFIGGGPDFLSTTNASKPDDTDLGFNYQQVVACTEQTETPTAEPTVSPTGFPSESPTLEPTQSPEVPTDEPTTISASSKVEIATAFTLLLMSLVF